MSTTINGQSDNDASMRAANSLRRTLTIAPGVGHIEISVRHDERLKAPATTRPRTFAERQPYIVAYGAAISAFSPMATAYQLCKLYKIKPGAPQLARMSLSIFPHQVALKSLQMNASTPVKEHLNPWAAFAVVGVLQGAVYGQANVHFSNTLQLTKKAASLAGVFRGAGFAGLRDTISQGVPFMCSDMVRANTLDRMWPTSSNAEDSKVASAKQWMSVIGTSVVATYMSQGLHNFQTTMQADQTVGYGQAVRNVFKQHGVTGMIRGAEARVGLLLIVNVLNELLLKPAWAEVPLE